jgi:hypothetical protein
MHTATSKVEILSQVLPNKLTFFRAGNPYRREMLSTNDLLIEKGCFVKKIYSFSMKNGCSEFVSKRRSTVPIFPLQ